MFLCLRQKVCMTVQLESEFFMIRLYEATSDERWLKEAEEAAAHIIATQVGSEWYQHTPYIRM